MRTVSPTPLFSLTRRDSLHLIQLLLGPDNDGKDLIWMAVDGLARVFDMNVRLSGSSLLLLHFTRCSHSTDSR